jgi:hypothetical protein
MELSAPEQRLLDFSRERFGEHLSQFLLSGLGEEPTGQRWRFTINYAGDESAALKRQVEVITHKPLDGSSSLPRGRDPLVLAVLLHLLLTGSQASSTVLSYEHEEVLSLLGWKDTRKACGAIDEAVQRYFKITYKWGMNKTELARQKLRFYTCDENLLSETYILSEEDAGGRIKRVVSRIVFNERFIERLLNRSLFGIDWDSVRSVGMCPSSK